MKKIKSFDFQSKYVLSRPLFLAYILHHCVSEFKSIDMDVIASHCIRDVMINQQNVHRYAPFLTQFEDNSFDEGRTTFDIFFKASLPETKDDFDFYINLETQDVFYPGYPLASRGIYYGGRMLYPLNYFSLQEWSLY